MAFTDENLATLKRHFEKLGRVPVCPVCGTSKWNSEGVERALGVSDPVSLIANPNEPAIVVVPLVCLHCYFVMHFAWVPIRDGLTT